VTFLWKDRYDKDNPVMRPMTLPGTEFVNRYLRHVLPRGLRSIRYYGFCHPAEIKKRQRIAFHTGIPLQAGAATEAEQADDGESIETPLGIPKCKCCGILMKRIASFPPITPWKAANRPAPKRGPPDCPAVAGARVRRIIRAEAKPIR
jgi:hypothetical protein